MEEEAMALEPPFPELDEFLAAIGTAGQRVGELATSEGAAGNISISIGWPIEVRRRFPLVEPFELPLSLPHWLAGA
jgi:rhamnulose-1-phosphate aldolase